MNKSENKKIATIIRNARKLIGKPYKYGALESDAPNYFDCSSFTQYLFKQVGYNIPRTTVLQASEGNEVRHLKDIRPGDLIFFESTQGHYWHYLFENRKIYIGHAALYIGNGEIITAEEQENRGKVYIEKLKKLAKNQYYKPVLIKRIIGFKYPNFAVPPYSQLLDVKNTQWKKKSCGVTSLKMTMDYWQKRNARQTPDIDTLIDYGNKINAYRKNVGWEHKGLLKIAKKFGFDGKLYDWSQSAPRNTFILLKSKLKIPVIASINKNLTPQDSGHLVVITGYTNDKILYNDPNSKNRNQIKKSVPINRFEKGWKKRIIVIWPKK